MAKGPLGAFYAPQEPMQASFAKRASGHTLPGGGEPGPERAGLSEPVRPDRPGRPVPVGVAVVPRGLSPGPDQRTRPGRSMPHTALLRGVLFVVELVQDSSDECLSGFGGLDVQADGSTRGPGTPCAAAAAALTAGRKLPGFPLPARAVLFPSRPSMSAGRKIGMSALRLYLAVAMILVIIKIVQLAIGH